MTNKELENYFKRLAKVYLKQKNVDFTGLIDFAIMAGRDDFWGEYPWAFKEKHDTVTTTESQETVDLPVDFEGVVSVVEQTSTPGFKLQKYETDEYDRLIPHSTGQNESTPKVYKVYYDKTEGLWRLALYPTPNAAISLYLTYHTIADNGEIPKKYIGGLTAGIAQYLFIPGSQGWLGAHQAFLSQVERLALMDNPDVGPVTKVLDSSDEPKLNIGNWFEEYIAGRT